MDLVAALYYEQQRVLRYLQDAGEISYAASLERALPKVLLLASASHLESRVCAILIEYFTELTGDHPGAVSFVRNKAIRRQYHTFFSWDGRNANQFFGLFGEQLKATVQRLVGQDDRLSKSIRDFLEIGSLRNQLVHGDYAAFTVEKTAKDLFDQHVSALTFVGQLPSLIRIDISDMTDATTAQLEQGSL